LDFAAIVFSPGREAEENMTLPLEGTLALRRRNSWEAADAGLLLWRANFVYFLPFFALPVWICAIALRMLPEDLRFWSWLILWYLKPLFDRPVLHIISVRFFEPCSGAGRIFQGLGKTIFRGLPGDLLWRRLSPLRSAVMPLRVLEKLRGRGIRKRKQDLARGGLSFCGMLTLWGFFLEAVLFSGEVIFTLTFLNIIQADYVSNFGDFFIRLELFFFAAWCFPYMLVESMYVCMGFGLYVNSRVEVEGWDIELVLRKLTEARKKKTGFPGAPVLLLLAALFLPLRIHAESWGPAEPGVSAGVPAADGNAPGGDAAFETLKEILASDDFGGHKTDWRIRLKEKENDRDLFEEPPDIDLAPWVNSIRQGFAFILRLVLVLGICVLGLLCVRYLYKNRREKTFSRGGWKITSGFDSPGESPETLLEKARTFYEGGDLRRAWGCCIAALFESWSRYRRPVFPPGTTEYGCLALVRAAGGAPAETERFAAAVTRWTAFAYGGRPPPAGSFEEALAFCGALIPEPEPEQSDLPGKKPEAAGV
jgi:hypothetical protein